MDDLIAYARDAAGRGEDLFQLLGCDATSTEPEIRRAFRKKALKAHPDKAGAGFDPALYARLERARDVLLDAGNTAATATTTTTTTTTAAADGEAPTRGGARAAYDAGMRARLEKKAHLDAMDVRKRRMVEDLLRREAEAAKRARTSGRPEEDQSAEPVTAEKAARIARGRSRMEERRKQMEEAEARERERERMQQEQEEQEASQKKQEDKEAAEPDYDDRIAHLERRLDEVRRRKEEKRRLKKAKSKDMASNAAAPPLVEL